MRVLPCEGDGPVKRLLHADLYRLDHLGEVVDLGLLELVEDEAVAAVEWGDAGAPVLGAEVLNIHIAQPDDNGSDGGSDDGSDSGSGSGDQRRTITLEGTGSWTERAGELAAALAPSA
jgi:hypothetical protein